MFFILLVLVVLIAVLKVANQKTYPALWSGNIKALTNDNKFWRDVIHTSKNFQISLMNVPVGEELGWENHPDSDQLFRVVDGNGILEVDATGDKHTTILDENTVAIVGQGNYHNVKNTSDRPLKLYTVYAPPHHAPGTRDVDHAAEIRKR